MLVVWMMSYWLCDNPSTDECRPVRAVAFETRGECFKGKAAVRREHADAVAVHCHHKKP